MNIATDQGRVIRIFGFVEQAKSLKSGRGWVLVLDGWVCGESDSPDDGILRRLDGAEVPRYGKDCVVRADGMKL